MIDLRPALRVYGELVKKYKRKSDGLLVYSKTKPIETFTTPTYNCRELVINYINYEIMDKTLNRRARNNPYKLFAYASDELDSGKVAILKSRITLMPNEFSVVYSLSDSIQREKVIKAVYYTLGIISTCLSHGTREEERMKVLDLDKLVRITSSGVSKTIEIDLLSPYWLTHPVLVSLILGLARQCISYVYQGNYTKQLDELFNSIDYDEVKRIIKDVDEKEARKVYYKYLVPFFSKYHHNTMLLFSEKHRQAISGLIDNGYEIAFDTNKLWENWSRYSSTYGFNKFSAYITSPRSRRGYDNYK